MFRVLRSADHPVHPHASKRGLSQRTPRSHFSFPRRFSAPATGHLAIHLGPVFLITRLGLRMRTTVLPRRSETSCALKRGTSSLLLPLPSAAISLPPFAADLLSQSFLHRLSVKALCAHGLACAAILYTECYSASELLTASLSLCISSPSLRTVSETIAPLRGPRRRKRRRVGA